jgi:hypothetical protein
MRITRHQLRQIIAEAIDPREMEEPVGGYVGDALTGDPDYVDHTGMEVEPERFKSFRDAVAAGKDMALGHDPSQKLGATLPWEVRVVLIDPGSLDGEYALYAMKDHDDRYDGEGKAIAAVPRDGDVRHGKQIG